MLSDGSSTFYSNVTIGELDKVRTFFYDHPTAEVTIPKVSFEE